MPSATQIALRRIRGQDPDVMSAGSMGAPLPNSGGLDQAYGAPMDPRQGAQPGVGTSAFQFNPGLEQQAAPNNIPMHPMILKIMQQFGLLNLLRNQSNQSVVDPMAQG